MAKNPGSPFISSAYRYTNRRFQVESTVGITTDRLRTSNSPQIIDNLTEHTKDQHNLVHKSAVMILVDILFLRQYNLTLYSSLLKRPPWKS